MSVEEEFARSVDETLKVRIERIQHLIRLTLDLIKNPPQLEPPRLNLVVSGLLARNAVLLEGIITCAKSGLPAVDQILNRSLFENTLHIAFLVRDSVDLFDFNPAKKTLDLFGLTLNHDTRLNLYIAWCTIKGWRNVRDFCDADEPLKSMGNQMIVEADKAYQSQIKTVGQNWTKRLESKPTCAGVSVKSLAFSLDDNYKLWYIYSYGRQSQHTHTSSVSCYLDYEGNDWNIRLDANHSELEEGLATAAVIGIIALFEVAGKGGVSDQLRESIREFYNLLLQTPN